MRLTTLESRLKEASSRANNVNAKRYIDKVVDKFNKSDSRKRDELECSFPGDVFNFAWAEVDLYKKGRRVKTIRISLP